MTPAFVTEIVTPKKYVLNALWFGPKKPRRAIIFIHGLTASAFSMRHIVAALVDSSTAVLTFNNRGFEQISEVKRIIGKKRTWALAGAGHEKFTDCVDDIEGAINVVRRHGVKNIYLAGHSTGAQKAIYSASKVGKGVKGIILLGPLSDYSILVSQDRKGKLQKAVAYAKRLVQKGKSHQLMSANSGLWFPCDAQRFLSLSTPDSAEEIFMYTQPKKNPRTLNRVDIPTLVFLAHEDEHGDRSAKEIGKWFTKHMKNGRVVIVPRVNHGFKGAEREVARKVKIFMKEL